ncbi:hypothetical protein HMPREF9412_2615 [Paenibacillus sp. HGF5]|nr:hypothetical protein HMPREF9412_2615 [Paenibacillus sp. HGF5]
MDVHYAPDSEAPSHPLNGKRFKDLSLKLKDGQLINSYPLLHKGTFLLVRKYYRIVIRLRCVTAFPLGELEFGASE